MEMTIQTRRWSESRADCINVKCKERKDKVQYKKKWVFLSDNYYKKKLKSILKRFGGFPCN